MFFTTPFVEAREARYPVAAGLPTSPTSPAPAGRSQPGDLQRQHQLPRTGRQMDCRPGSAAADFPR